MKGLLLIFSLILSLLGGGRTEAVCEAVAPQTLCSVGKAPSSDRSIDHRLNRDLCITSAQSYSLTGGSSFQSVSVRNSHSGRRTSPETKSTSRIVKSGKIIDNNHLHPFLRLSFCVLSGPLTSERYLYSLCRLRC